MSFLGVHSAREIPVPIPNTEVKPGSGDYTALRETSKMPNYTNKPPQRVAFCRLRQKEARDLLLVCITNRLLRPVCIMSLHVSEGSITTGLSGPGSIISMLPGTQRGIIEIESDNMDKVSKKWIA